MIRTLIRLGLTLAGNALGLWIASMLLDKMSLSASGFIIAVVIFTVLTIVLQPLITKMAMKNAEALQGSSALVSTFVALVITALVSDSLNIDGVTTWIFATVIVWLITMVAGVLLPILFLKKAVDAKA